MKQKNKNTTPTITWQPCKPVNKKNTLEYIPSCKLKVDSKYSIPCNIIKKNPKKIVSKSPSNALLKEPILMPRCAQVTLKHEKINNKVL